MNISTLCHALGCEFEPWWWQTLFQAQAQHLCFLHDSIWFIWFDTIICLSNLLCELWNRKLKIKELYILKMLMDNHTSQQHAGLHHTVWWLQLEVTRSKVRFKPTLPEKPQMDGGAIRCRHILVSCFTCTRPFQIGNFDEAAETFSWTWSAWSAVSLIIHNSNGEQIYRVTMHQVIQTKL